ncbi:hypothetical protein JCM10213_007997 [Rhodosporidiobolus nylandii]
MSYGDQYIELPAAQPTFDFHLPTPVASAGDYPASSFMIPSSSVSSTSSIPIPGSRPTSRAGAPSLSRSSSTRHHPYSASPASFADRAFRPRSATSVSERSGWETDASASFDFSGSSVDSFAFSTPSSSYDQPSLSSPTATASTSMDSPFVAMNQPRGKNGKAKSHARKTAPGHIKRPPNAFILFRSHCCSPEAAAAAVDPPKPEPPGTAHARHLAGLEINNSQHISVIVSQVWKGLTAEEKAYWEQKAREAKEEHQRLHPDYRYRPQQRAKESSRRRKRTGQKESLEHRNACNEVARQVLEIERARTRQRNPAASVLGDDLPIPPTMLGVSLDEAAGQWAQDAAVKVAPAAAAKKKRVRKAPARKATSPEAIFNIELTDEYPPPPPGSVDVYARPQTAAALESFPSSLPTGEFFAPNGQHPFGGFGRRPSKPSTAQAYTAQDAADQFSFMAQLELQPPNEQPVLQLDPQLAALELSRPWTAAGHHSPPAAMPANPSFTFLPPNPSTFTLPNPTISRAPSPRSEAIQQLQRYEFGGPSVSSSPFSTPASAALLAPQQQTPVQISPTGTTFSFGNEGPGVTPVEHRRAVTAPAPLPLDALKQRRGTLRPGDLSAAQGDLMLISPMTTTFDGRKQSTGTWSAGLRRLSLTPGGDGAADAQGTAEPPFRRTSLAAGVLSANETFETFSFPQSMLESLPVEDPSITAEFFAQFTQAATPFTDYDYDEGDEASRPSTACSDWSTTDDEIERLEGDLPSGYLDRRRSTTVPAKFMASAFSTAPSSSIPSPAFSAAPFSAPATHSGFHVGSTDFFVPPPPPLATAGPTTAAFSAAPSPSGMPAFGSPEFGGSFRPFETRPSVDAILAAEPEKPYGAFPLPPSAGSGPSHHASPDVPVSVTGAEDDWIASSHAAVTAAGMRDTALSILQQRIQHRPQPSLDEVASMQQPAECEYVMLTYEQMADPKLMAEIHKLGIGIAFASAPVNPPTSPLASPPNHHISAGETLLASAQPSPLPLQSATF